MTGMAAALPLKSARSPRKRMIGHSLRTVAFFEHDLRAKIPACAVVAAAALAQGWRFPPKGIVCHEDVTYGCRHIQDFRGAAESGRNLTRVIYFTFIDSLRIVEGDKMFISDFCARCSSDRAFWRAMQQHRLYERIRATLSANLFAAAKSVCAMSEDRPDRRCIVPLGGNPEAIAWFANRYETVG